MAGGGAVHPALRVGVNTVVPAAGTTGRWVHLLRTVLWDDAGMVAPVLPADPSSPLRRRLLRAAVLAPLAGTLATLPGCSLPVQVDGTFLQPWRSHLQWGLADWQRSLKLAHTLGCRQLVLQWTGIVGGSDGDWSLPTAACSSCSSPPARTTCASVSAYPSSSAGGRRSAPTTPRCRRSWPTAWRTHAAGWHRRRGPSSRPSGLVPALRTGAVPLGRSGPPAMAGAMAARAGRRHRRARR